MKKVKITENEKSENTVSDRILQTFTMTCMTTVAGPIEVEDPYDKVQFPLY